MPIDAGLTGPFHPPAVAGPPRQVVVMLHGYGADGNDLIGLAPLIGRALPQAVFYAPHAPEPCEVWADARQWFSLATYDPDALRRDADRMGPVHQAMVAGARAAAPALNAFLDDVLARHALPPERLALVGFSQGTMMALHVALGRPGPVAGVLGYSGALLGAATIKTDIRSKPPVMLIHGTADDVIPSAATLRAEAALRAEGVPVAAHLRPGVPHGIDDVGITLGIAFLVSTLAAG